MWVPKIFDNHHGCSGLVFSLYFVSVLFHFTRIIASVWVPRVSIIVVGMGVPKLFKNNNVAGCPANLGECTLFEPFLCIYGRIYMRELCTVE